MPIAPPVPTPETQCAVFLNILRANGLIVTAAPPVPSAQVSVDQVMAVRISTAAVSAAPSSDVPVSAALVSDIPVRPAHTQTVQIPTALVPTVEDPGQTAPISDGLTPATPVLPAPIPAPIVPIPATGRFDLADPVRLPWTLTIKSNRHYVQQVPGRWWSTSEADYHAIDSSARRYVIDHVGRIMETALGEQRHGNNRCTKCIENNEECWVYVPGAHNRVPYAATPTCARCRWGPRGCSFTRRRAPARRSEGSEHPVPGVQPFQPVQPGQPVHFQSYQTIAPRPPLPNVEAGWCPGMLFDLGLS